MDDLSARAALPTLYPSSRGNMEIASMAYPHLLNAIAKMARENRTDDPVYAALCQRKDVMDAELAEAEANAPAAGGTIGDNGAPAETGLDAVKAKVEDIRIEAANWLDGTEIKTLAEASQVEKLLDLIRDARAEADKAKDAEKKPHMDAAQKVQDRYNALFGQTRAVTGTAVTIEAAIKTALTKWRNKLEADRQAEVSRLQAEADARLAKAREAHQASQFSTDLVEREEALAEIDDARQAAFDLAEANKAKTKGLRTVWDVEVTDGKALAAWFWANRKTELLQFMTDEARRTVRAMSGNVVINGVKNTSQQVAV